MACRREGISPCVLAQPGRPARVGSVTLHSQGFGSRQLRQEPHPADHATLEKGDAIGAGLALREGAPPGDVGSLIAAPAVAEDHKSLAGPSKIAPARQGYQAAIAGSQSC